LSQISRAKFRDAMRGLGLLDAIPETVWHVDWNVHCQAVGASEASLKYLAPYVFRVAISESRLLKVEARTVWFHYRKPGSRRLRTLALEVLEFIRRFLQHVLPPGFMQIRYDGFMNPNTAIPPDRLAALIELAYAFALERVPPPAPEPPPPMLCPQCRGLLIYRWTLRPRPRSP
jgi:hypothetical protein